MWAPETTFDWGLLGYLLAGLLYAAMLHHELTSEKSHELMAEVAESYSPGLYRRLYAIATTLMMLIVVLLWPAALAWISWRRLRRS